MREVQMKITILNGSPKGDNSVTMQYVKFVEKKNSQHQYNYINVAQKIKKIEEDIDFFNNIIEEIKNSDLIIWGSPLYVCLVPSQYKRFIELIWERGAVDSFSGKYAAVITTSIHFFDHTAQNYLRGICEDLNMNFAGGFSPDMYDIMKDTEREKLLFFAESVFETADGKLKTSRSFKKPDYVMPVYVPETHAVPVNTDGKTVLILSDREYAGDNMERMIKQIQGAFGENAKSINLSSVDIKGGCLGCCECGFDYRCVYTGKDGFIDFYNEEVKRADIIIFAGEIRDRYLSAKWKLMFDRAFFNTHTPTLTGKQAGFILSGPLSEIANLREIIQAYFEWQGANLADIVTDENSSADIDSLINNLAAKLLKSSASGYVQPATFLGVGGMRIFRDDIWGRLKFVFQADYKYYEESGIFDFPQDDEKAIEINAKMIALTDNPDMRENIRKMIKNEMVKPMKYVVDNK
jgi:multimeric flavodoxin WrbA